QSQVLYKTLASHPHFPGNIHKYTDALIDLKPTVASLPNRSLIIQPSHHASPTANDRPPCAHRASAVGCVKRTSAFEIATSMVRCTHPSGERIDFCTHAPAPRRARCAQKAAPYP